MAGDIVKKKPSLLDKLKDVMAKRQVKKEQEISTEWLKAQLQNFTPYARKVKSSEVLSDKRYDPTTRMIAGQMFVYVYSAKYKDTLPFWDQFPLVIILKIESDHILGLNLHYLPPELRARFFDALLETLNTNNIINERSRLILTYNLLKSASRYKYFKPCIKKYLTSNIKSKIVRIPQEEWVKTLFLNSASWQNAGQATVYKWSKDQINK